MDDQSTLSLFDRTGARLKGHFRLTSGLHSDQYLQCALVLQHPANASELGAALADRLTITNEVAGKGPITLTVSPAMGGLMIGHEVARHLNTRHIFTERDSAGKMTLRRGFSVTPGDAAVIIEDVITTGGSTREVVDLLRELGADVRAAASIIDRSGGTADVGIPRVALATLQVQTWDPAVCPLCAAGGEAIKPGSRK
ncbi:MAG: orotate phosphoribosyltransferase [Acidobacteria bacterium]|nr:orotate phosphoribosyltransferase [Acidobacteriota bacterium]